MQRRVQPTSEVIRAGNRARVVDILRRSGSATRAELSTGTGLSRATVSSLIGELADRGLVSEHTQPAADSAGTSVYRGRDGYAGELGHVTSDPDGPACWCGRRGCLELYAGAEGMLARLAGRGIRLHDVNELILRAEAGDSDVIAVISDGTRRLARSLGALALVLNPSVIALGGELTALGALLLDPVRAELATVPFGAPVAVRASALGPRASLMGALALVLSESSRFTDQSCAPAAPDPGRVTAFGAAPAR